MNSPSLLSSSRTGRKGADTIFGKKETVDFIIPDNDETRHIAFAAVARALAGSNRKEEICVYVASALTMVLPELQPHFDVALSELSIAITQAKLPSDADAVMISVDNLVGMTWPEILVLCGCYILNLFKNVESQSFHQYFGNRIRALRAKVGVVSTSAVANVPYTIEVGRIIREALGQCINLKRNILLTLLDLATQPTMAGLWAQYLTSILAFNEMQPFVFMFETVLVTDSPVLLDLRVQHEVLPLTETMSYIVGCEHPQFYRYLGGPAAQAHLERSKFPILMAVAQELKRQNHGSKTVRNFITTATSAIDKQLVDDLVRIHNQDNSFARLAATEAARDFLTGKDCTG